MSAITIKSIRKSYGKLLVLKSITLNINDGEFFFLLGPSGCGKSTLLRILAGLDSPDSGELLFDGKDVLSLEPQFRNIGMVFQSYALWPHMTVFQNIEFGLEMRKVSLSERRERVQEALNIVRMTEYAASFPSELSGGQQQRVALARALVLKPHVILLDEPLSNLDTKLRIDLRRELRRIHQDTKVTMIYVTHDQSEALSLGTTIAVMKEGEILQLGSPTNLLQNPADNFVRTFLAGTSLMSATVMSSREGLLYLKTDSSEITVSSHDTVESGSNTLLSVQASLISN